MTHYKLFIPGPCDVDDDVLDAMSQPVMRHYGPEWLEVYDETLALLQQVFQTRNDLFIIPGAGSAATDMALGSLLATGQKVIVGHNGFFGERLVEIAQSYGLNVVRFSAPLGHALAPDDLHRALREHPDAPVVALVHHETTTTVLNPLRELAELTRQAGRVLVVDAISTLGGVDLPVDAWGIDVCVTASNKCLACPPGLVFISVSPRAWAQIDAAKSHGHGWYLDLKVWREYRAMWAGWYPYPVTLPTNNILGLRVSLRKILAQGLEAQFARHTRACQAVRAGLRNIGFEMFVPDEIASPITTAIKARPEFTISELTQWLANEHHLLIGGGFGELADKVWRVGHLGRATTREYMMELLFAVEEFLRFKGLDVPVGASLVGL